MGAAALVAAFAPAPAAAQTVCAAADASPRAASASQAQSAILCLLNAERRRRGVSPLRENPRLRTAATRHARDMVRRRYFAHDSLSGAPFSARIARTRYLSGARSWRLGENIAWGSGEAGSARNIVRAWMESPGHRRNVLDRGFRDIGIAAARGAPRGTRSDAATYVTDFGVLRR